MSGKTYVWNEEKRREVVDPPETEENTFIEFSANGSANGTPAKNAAAAGENGVVAVDNSNGTSDVEKKVEDEEDERGGWGNKLDFLFSCISVSVGLGNVWRFPYLCYKNGGGAFLITYGIAMLLCGIPIFFQEVAIGQYLGSGGMTLVGQLCPILQGVGFATMIIVFFLNVYYCIIIAWTLFYLVNSLVDLPGLPWQDCDNWWNTDKCNQGNSTVVMNSSIVTMAANHTNHSTTPVEEYWDHRVLGITDGIENLGGLQWELVGCLLLGWILVYVIIWRGLHQSGKIIWFTALFPYVVLFILLVRAVTLEGADGGLLYYITPQWEMLLTPGPWIDGATQIFFAYSVGTGALPALGSYNKFHHNCYRDALITCVVNTFTCLLAGCVTFSILGHIAQLQSSSVADVVKSGPGLVFLTYPEVVLKLPGAPAWAVIFFIMLVILGIDSEFCNVESFITGVVDYWPEVLRPHRRKFTLAVCFLMFLLGLPMVTQGGAYVFQLMDFYSASGMTMLWVCFFQTIAIGWFFGAKNFCACIEQMTGVRPNKFWYICWVLLAPLVMFCIFIFFCARYEPIKYGKTYDYPWWAEMMGFGMSFASMLWIPTYAIYYLLSQPGTLKENLLKGLTPNIKSTRVKPTKTDKAPVIPMSESSAGLLAKNNSFFTP